MVEELYQSLKKEYSNAKIVIYAKWLSDEIEEKESENYDIPLLTIFWKDLAEEVPKEEPIAQVRVRDDGNGEELVIVLTTQGINKTVEDIDDELHFAAGAIERFTEKVLLAFPDAIFRYEWGKPIE